MAHMGALGLAALLALAAGDAAAEISGDVVKIGVLNDQSGVYSDGNGQGSVAAARMAVEDVGEVAPGVQVEVVFADHQNKPDVGSEIARRWLDTEGVDAIVDLPTSSVALAVVDIARARDKAVLVSSGGSARLTGDACSPVTVQWTYDTWALAHGTGKAVVETGGTSWFFLTADYVFGHDLEAQTARGREGERRHRAGLGAPPLEHARLLLLPPAGEGLRGEGGRPRQRRGDTSNAIKQAREFGLVAGGQQLVGLLTDVSVVHSLGLETAQGLRFVEPFYWDLNEGTRAFGRRFAAQMRGRMPTQEQAGVYGVVLHYLKAVRASGTDAGAAVVAKMKELPTDDPLFGKGVIRADGRKLHPMYLFEVKSPAESKGPWDYYKLVRTIPAEEAFRPLDQGGCPMVAKKG